MPAPIRAERLRRATIFVPLLLATSGCLSVPDLGPRPEPRPMSAIPGAHVAAPAGQWPADHWWAAYDDAQLTGLIDEALASSPTMDEAAARVRRARANVQQSHARQLPSLDLTASGGAVQQSENATSLPAGLVPHDWNDSGQIALGLSFDLDLWGRNRAAMRAALSDADAAAADAAGVRLMLSTAIAASYAELARHAAVRVTNETYLRIRGDTLRLMRARQAQGLENQAAVDRAEAGRASAAADLAATDEQIALNRNQIAALLGAGPERGHAIALPRAARLQAFGLPADVGISLAGRRPDVVAARIRAEAAGARIDVAHADFFPNVRLSALIGLQALGIGNLISGGSTYGSAGPAISLPIFSGGRIQGAYRGARADYDAAVASYNGAVVDALREVADVAARQQALGRRLGESRAALAASESAFRLLDARYRGGLATYLDVLTAEDSLNQSRRAVAELEASAFALDVALVRALGGGFTATPNA